MAEDQGEILPVGIHLMGKRRDEAKLFALGSFLAATKK
jgi:Asp-tRNA(Asn)/Glu-tRNA(Gln) amidotransferase A subunit family amidase